MNFMRSLLLIATLAIVSACSTTAPVTDVPDQSTFNTITCVHKYESSWGFTYEKQNITRYVANNVVQFYIKDVTGQDIFLNIYEIENYNCR